MAGLPNKIIIRAKDLLFDFMNKKTKYSKINTKRKNSQLDLFDKDSKLLKKIKELDIDSISPIDALNILNDLKNDS